MKVERLWTCDRSSDAQRTCHLNQSDVLKVVSGFPPGGNRGGVMLALQERSRYGSAQPFRLSVCDEAPMLARSLCVGEGLSGGVRQIPC